jgi:hypothetical protein
MSDGPSIRDHRITKPYFRTCSSHNSRSQALFYLYARCLIADQAESTFGLLRYSFGGDRPSQTAQLTLSAARFHGTALELRHVQGGISPLAPSPLARQLHSLPPILHRTRPRPISAYSKGSRGLSVTLRERGIFTTATISPGHWLRQ